MREPVYKVLRNMEDLTFWADESGVSVVAANMDDMTIRVPMKDVEVRMLWLALGEYLGEDN